MTTRREAVPAIRIGIDIGGTKVLGVALGPGDEIMAEARRPTPRGVAVGGTEHTLPVGGEVVDVLVSVIDELSAASGPSGGPVPTVGIGAPGMVDAAGVLRVAPNLPAAAGADFRALVGARLPDHPVTVENDANCAVWAENALGAAQGADDVLLVTLGTGIGGGMLSQGQLLRGARGFAGELGHLVVDPDGPPCPCGRRGCWERFASGPGLGSLAREAARDGRVPAVVRAAGGDPEDVHGEHVTAAAAQGDPGALEVIAELGYWVALGLANLVAVLDPELIVIGGGLAGVAPLLLEPARRAFFEQVEGGSARPEIEIVAAHFAERAGAVGAALLAAGEANIR